MLRNPRAVDVLSPFVPSAASATFPPALSDSCARLATRRLPPTPRYKIDRATDLQQLSRDCELDSNRTGGNMGDEAPKAIAAPIADRRASAHLGALAQVVGPEPEGQGRLALADPTGRNESYGFGKDTPPAMG